MDNEPEARWCKWPTPETRRWMHGVDDVGRAKAGAPIPARLLWNFLGEPWYNMACDRALFETLNGGAEQEGSATFPVLRLYGWSVPALSLGRFETVCGCELPPELRPLPRVRRITGGGAVWHREELTFCVVGRPSSFGGRSGPGRVRAAVCRVLDGVLLGLERLGVRAWKRSCKALGAKRTGLPVLCFERSVGTAIECEQGRLVGTAQRCSRRAWLIHGSIPLGAQPNARGATTLSRVLAREVTWEEAARAMVWGLSHALHWDVEPRGVSAAEQRLIEQILEKELCGAVRAADSTVDCACAAQMSEEAL